MTSKHCLSHLYSLFSFSLGRSLFIFYFRVARNFQNSSHLPLALANGFNLSLSDINFLDSHTKLRNPTCVWPHLKLFPSLMYPPFSRQCPSLFLILCPKTQTYQCNRLTFSFTSSLGITFIIFHYGCTQVSKETGHQNTPIYTYVYTYIYIDIDTHIHTHLCIQFDVLTLNIIEHMEFL